MFCLLASYIFYYSILLLTTSILSVLNFLPSLSYLSSKQNFMFTPILKDLCESIPRILSFSVSLQTPYQPQPIKKMDLLQIYPSSHKTSTYFQQRNKIFDTYI
jgi:hypothetical protein